MDSSSGNSGNYSGNRQWHPACQHGSCHMQTSFSLQNPGRRFWCCPIWNEPNTCGFFSWYEEPYEGQVRRLLITLINKHKQARTMLETREREKRELEGEADRLEEECRLKDLRLLQLKSEKKLLKQVLRRTRAAVGGIFLGSVVGLLLLAFFNRGFGDTRKLWNSTAFCPLQ